MPPFNLGEILALLAGLLTLGAGLGLFVEHVVEYFLKPLLQLLPWLNDMAEKLVVKYVALAAGFLLAWFAGYDLFTPLLTEFGLAPHRLLGPIMSAVLVGGGSSLIHGWIESWSGETLRTTGLRRPAGPEWETIEGETSEEGGITEGEPE